MRAGAETTTQRDLRYLDLAAFERAKLVGEPFPHMVVPGFLDPERRQELSANFPRIDQAGSFPTAELSIGPVFRNFLDELESPELKQAFERKFDMDLSGRPTMITVRGQARARDGQIHNDSRTKLITVLIYMNEQWEPEAGRLRLLRSPDSLEDPVVEVPPDAGTLLAFRVTENSWHGHHSVEGPRRAIQLNWVESEAVVRRERNRHRLSARVKRLIGHFGG